jgi:hypothetical protein
MLRRLIVAAGAVLCLAPATAHASGQDVINDCSDHGRLTKSYTQKEYRDALAHMPTDLDEYTDCRDIIRRAQLNLGSGGGGGHGGATGGSTGGGSTGGGTPASAYDGLSPADQARARRDAADAGRRGAAPQRIADTEVNPGALAFHDVSSVSELPTPMIVLALLILVGVLATFGYVIRSRVGSGGPRT